MSKIVDCLSRCFLESSPADKIHFMKALSVDDQDLLRTLQQGEKRDETFPARDAVSYPENLRLVDAKFLPKRSLKSIEGRGAFFHAICHIEYTAINLALDAALYFTGLPLAYYRDWLQIAKEEAHHFELLQDHLREIGFRYGDFDAHSGMWDLAERTSHDLLLRMALVPRVLEARGLDVTPPMIERLEQAGDIAGAKLLQRIYEDEITHVAAGTRWFQFVAKQRGLEPEEAFHRAVKNEFGVLRTNKLNRRGRILAGFSEHELALIVSS